MRDRNGNNVPAKALAFAQWLETNGWYYVREWTWPGDYGGGVVIEEGFWTELGCHDVVKEWPREDDVWHFCLGVSEHIYTREETWPAWFRLAEMTSEMERISCRVPFAFAPSAGASSGGASA